MSSSARVKHPTFRPPTYGVTFTAKAEAEAEAEAENMTTGAYLNRRHKKGSLRSLLVGL